jgi:hypothetical protein
LKEAEEEAARVAAKEKLEYDENLKKFNNLKLLYKQTTDEGKREKFLENISELRKTLFKGEALAAQYAADMAQKAALEAEEERQRVLAEKKEAEEAKKRERAQLAAAGDLDTQLAAAQAEVDAVTKQVNDEWE